MCIYIYVYVYAILPLPTEELQFYFYDKVLMLAAEFGNKYYLIISALILSRSTRKNKTRVSLVNKKVNFDKNCKRCTSSWVIMHSHTLIL